MPELIAQCPVCNEALQVSTLRCSGCGLELRSNFQLSAFDRLSPEQYDFLINFLKNRGNLKAVQAHMKLSYPAAKKKLSDLLAALGLEESIEDESTEGTYMDVEQICTRSHWASELVKNKLISCGGKALVRSIKGKEYEVRVIDSETFSCDNLPTCYFKVFDVIADLLCDQGGQAKKGNARSGKLGSPQCEETTIAGAILKNYFRKEIGESGFDPVFGLIAILEWAGIVCNKWGSVELTGQYMAYASEVKGPC